MSRRYGWCVALALSVALNVHAATAEAADDAIATPPAATGSICGSDDQDSLVPPEDRRGVEQTLLTYPEWQLVFSPADYARMVRTHPSHDFPFITQIGQLWSGYRAVAYEQHRCDYPFNAGYHVMIAVIASSTTVEYGIRAVYGNTVGRLSWILGGARETDEDRFDAQTAQDYVDFIRQQPWYLFDFGTRLKALWTDVPMSGPGPVRKWERRFALTSEYGVKAIYGRIIRIATHAAYDAPKMTTDVVVQNLPADWTPAAEVSVLKHFSDGRALLSLPRYYDFRIAATALAKQHVVMTDVAGNQSVILVAVWVPEGTPIGASDGRVLFSQPVVEPATMTRVVMLISVSRLSALLANAESRGWNVEHVFDY